VRIQLHPNVEGELTQAAVWYEERVSGLGEDLLSEVDRWFQVIAETPHNWPRWAGVTERDPPVRRVLLGKFPYAIAYQAFADRILVLAVAHTNRRPLYWDTRSDGGPLSDPG
jgi:toxin ParE1/3/4